MAKDLNIIEITDLLLNVLMPDFFNQNEETGQLTFKDETICSDTLYISFTSTRERIYINKVESYLTKMLIMPNEDLSGIKSGTFVIFLGENDMPFNAMYKICRLGVGITKGIDFNESINIDCKEILRRGTINEILDDQ